VARGPRERHPQEQLPADRVPGSAPLEGSSHAAQQATPFHTLIPPMAYLSKAELATGK